MPRKELLTSFDSIFALGGIGLTFSNKDRTIVHGLVIDGDALLAVMGIVSTITTIIAGWTFQHLSGTILTTWMTGERGATPSDLHLEEELKNPIAAFSRFKTVFKRGNRWKPLFRLCITAITGICVLLVAASVNTIAIPKSRWYPDPRFGVPDPSDDRYYFDNQTSRVGSVSFMNTWGQGFAVVREGGLVSWEMVRIMQVAPSKFVG
jgi:RsiW-degrading membrane proteinase PrsW (M82 family)